MTTKVTDVRKMTLRERYATSSGVLLPDMAEVARRIEETMPSHVREERKHGRETLNDLENAVRAFADKTEERQRAVDSLAPVVVEAERKVARCHEDVANQKEAMAENRTGARLELARAEIHLKFAQDSLAAHTQRQDINIKILAATKQLSLEWFKSNGELLTRLRKFAPGPRLGEKF